MCIILNKNGLRAKIRTFLVCNGSPHFVFSTFCSWLPAFWACHTHTRELSALQSSWMMPYATVDAPHGLDSFGEPIQLRSTMYVDRNPLGPLDHITHARGMLSQVYKSSAKHSLPRLTLGLQVYYRQNMYVVSAQYYDAEDIKWYLGPVIYVTVTFKKCINFVLQF